jgi:hypothetical protein
MDGLYNLRRCMLLFLGSGLFGRDWGHDNSESPLRSGLGVRVTMGTLR